MPLPAPRSQPYAATMERPDGDGFVPEPMTPELTQMVLDTMQDYRDAEADPERLAELLRRRHQPPVGHPERNHPDDPPEPPSGGVREPRRPAGGPPDAEQAAQPER